MKYLFVSFAFLFSQSVNAQDCIDDWEHKPGVLVERYSKEVASLEVESLKSNEDILLSFILVTETKSKNSHYAFQVTHLDYKKPADHRISKALIEQQEVKAFLEILEQFMKNAELSGGESNTTYSFITMNGLQLFGYYSDTGWHTSVIFDHYNNVWLELSFDDLQLFYQELLRAHTKVEQGLYLEL